MKQADSGTPSAGSVIRAFAILECLDGSRRGLNISELSRRLNIPKSSAHVIVLTLERLGYVERESGGLHYSLGLRAHALGQGMAKILRLADAAQAPMQRLTEVLRLPAHLAVPDKEQCVFIQKVDAPGLIKFDTYVGRRMALHCTAVGKVILAFGPPSIREHILSKPVYTRYTEHTLVYPQQLLREVEQVEKCGYAVDDEEEEMGVRSVAVPVTSAGRQFLAALSVTGTVRQIGASAVERIAPLLKSTAGEIGAEAVVQSRG